MRKMYEAIRGCGHVTVGPGHVIGRPGHVTPLQHTTLLEKVGHS